MARLIFEGREVAKLMRHALSCKTHGASYTQQDDYAKTLPKRKGKAVEWPELTKADHAKLETQVPAALWLVKDEGIYLMSNAAERMGGALGKSISDGGNVSYVKGYEPPPRDNDVAWEVQRERIIAAAGGDDFVELVDMPALEPGGVPVVLRLFEEGRANLAIDLEPEQFKVRIVARTEPGRKPRREARQHEG